MLKAEGKACSGPRSGINDQIIEKLTAWHHSGFSVHVGNRIAADDREGQTALAEYIMRNAFSEQKACPESRSGITYIEDTGKVLYRSAMTHGNNKKNFEMFTAEEFIAAITQHIPDKSFQMVSTMASTPIGAEDKGTRLASRCREISRPIPLTPPV